MGSISLQQLRIKPPSGWLLFLNLLRTRVSLTVQKAQTLTEIIDLPNK
jgi:hypothetical protein